MRDGSGGLLRCAANPESSMQDIPNPTPSTARDAAESAGERRGIQSIEVGGSLLSIGSAAGVAIMGQARGIYTFAAHLRWTPAIASWRRREAWSPSWTAVRSAIGGPMSTPD